MVDQESFGEKMISISLLIGLGIAIAFPVLAAKGKGWRGLWFGLSIAALVIVLLVGLDPVSTKEQTEAQLGYRVTQQQYELMNEMDPSVVALGTGAFLGCLIAGCVYRNPKGKPAT